MTINVTKTYLPSFKEYEKYLKKIWKSGWITNNGEFVVKLENKLSRYLKVNNLLLVTNGTLGLQLAIRSLDLSGFEIITTPFSYVASTSSIVWENCKPVFVDIDPNTLCIDTNLIEKAITKKTKAILAVHVYGNICDVEKIQKIAKKHKLKVVYDAAHAFGVKYKGKSILRYGDVSVLSFHATKIFHTVEGGALVAPNHKIKNNISYLRNFGHKGYDEFQGLGINAKMSELHAAMGLSVLPDVKKIIKSRKRACLIYDKLLKDTSIIKPVFRDGIFMNYSYYPVVFKTEKQLLEVKELLNKNNIFPRRYFYPSLNKLPYVEKKSCPISEDISKRVLCLPLYNDLKDQDVIKIVKFIKKVIQ